MTKLGVEIRRLRRGLGMTQDQLAAKIGQQHGSTVSDWETGKATPLPESYAKLAKALGVTVPHLESLQPPHDASAPRKGPDIPSSVHMNGRRADIPATAELSSGRKGDARMHEFLCRIWDEASFEDRKRILRALLELTDESPRAVAPKGGAKGGAR